MLPRTLSEWRGVLTAAIAIRPSDLRVPQHLLVRNRTTMQPQSFTTGPYVFNTTRFSGVLILLMPCLQQRQYTSSPAKSDEDSGAAPTTSTPTARAYLDLRIPVERRTSKLRAHSGEFALPGGRCDTGETPAAAAVRETQEEVGVPPFAYEVLGQTSRVFSYPSKSFVEPTVALATEDLSSVIHIASPDEVESIHYLSLGDLLLDPKRTHHELQRQFSGVENAAPLLMPSFSVIGEDPALVKKPSDRVWGLTAFVVSELLVRVAHVLRIDLGAAYSSATTPLNSPLVPYQNPYDVASRDSTHGDKGKKLPFSILEEASQKGGPLLSSSTAAAPAGRPSHL